VMTQSFYLQNSHLEQWKKVKYIIAIAVFYLQNGKTCKEKVIGMKWLPDNNACNLRLILYKLNLIGDLKK